MKLIYHCRVMDRTGVDEANREDQAQAEVAAIVALTEEAGQTKIPCVTIGGAAYPPILLVPDLHDDYQCGVNHCSATWEYPEPCFCSCHLEAPHGVDDIFETDEQWAERLREQQSGPAALGYGCLFAFGSLLLFATVVIYIFHQAHTFPK